METGFLCLRCHSTEQLDCCRQDFARAETLFAGAPRPFHWNWSEDRAAIFVVKTEELRQDTHRIGVRPIRSDHMPQLAPSEMLTYSTVRIECRLADGGVSTGTGFFFRFLNRKTTHVPAIVTNKHVVAGTVEGAFKMHEAGSDGSPHPKDNLDVRLDQFASRWIPHPDPNVDLCVLPAAPILREAETRGKRVFQISLYPSLIPSRQQLDELTAVEDILMIGYPNGIWDAANNMPIVRKGITATHPAKDYDGHTEFMIDAACFPGSSGSPVVLFNQGSYPSRDGALVMGTRVQLLGVLYAGPQHTAKGDIVIEKIPTTERPVAISRIPNNLGLVIRSERIMDFEKIFEQLEGAASA